MVLFHDGGVARLKITSLVNPLWYYPSIRSVLRLLGSRWQLFWEITKRELHDRYAGQALGSFWALLNPVLTMGVYLFIFAYVFRIRMPAATEAAAGGWGGSYALYLLSGLIPWMGFQEVMTRSTGSITGNANLVKQIVFPAEILPLKILGAALMTQCVALAIFLVYATIRFGPPSPMVLLVPWLLVCQVFAMAGFAMIFSSLSPFLRDVKDLVNLLCFVLIYAMPVFYTPGMLPALVSKLLLLNPFAHMVECWHDALYWGAFVSPWSWLVYPVCSLLVFAVGCRAFSFLKVMFGNVL